MKMHPMIMNYCITDILAIPGIPGIPDIPEKLRGSRSLTLLLGAGDMTHSGVTNVEQFSNYDILICKPENPENAQFQENVNKLSDTGPVICCLDVENNAAVAVFVNQFKGRFSLIEGHSAHIPHFTFDILEQLLEDGGTASNLFELSHNAVNVHMYLRWLEEGYISPYSNIQMSTSVLISNGAMTLNDDDATRVEYILREKIKYQNSINKNIHLSDDILANLSSFRYMICQKIYASLLHDNKTPLYLLGKVCMHTRSWTKDESIQLVLQKSPPLFWEDTIALYREKYGQTEDVIRARAIIEGIRNDISLSLVFPSKAKYATFLKHMRKNILPFMEGS